MKTTIKGEFLVPSFVYYIFKNLLQKYIDI
jgi:hypothetical protein